MANEYTGDDNQEDERTQAVFPLDDQMDIPPLNMPVLHDGSTFDAEPSGLAGLVQETQAKRQADAASAQTQESQETQAFDPLAELDDEAAPEPQPRRTCDFILCPAASRRGRRRDRRLRRGRHEPGR